MKNNLFGLSRRLSPGSVRKMMPMMLNFGSYLPMVMKAAVALKNMERVPELGWNPNAPHPFYEKEEKQDILERLEWLCKEVMVDPEALINKMPEAIGRQYQGQWAYYAISMTVASLSNIAFIYPEMREENLKKMPVLIDIALTPTIKLYDTMKWREDAIESLDGRKSHMTYLSILAWMIGHYKLTGGDGRYDALYHKICDALCRRMMASRDMNLPSFPNKIVFFPDMMFTPLAFTIYSRLYDGKYSDVVERWSELTRTKWLDPRTGLLISRYYASGKRQPPCGS